MANQSVKKPTWAINQNQINELLLKAEAMLYMALHSDLQNKPIYILHDYLCGLSDFISSAKKLTE